MALLLDQHACKVGADHRQKLRGPRGAQRQALSQHRHLSLFLYSSMSSQCPYKPRAAEPSLIQNPSPLSILLFHAKLHSSPAAGSTLLRGGRVSIAAWDCALAASASHSRQPGSAAFSIRRQRRHCLRQKKDIHALMTQAPRAICKMGSQTSGFGTTWR